VDLQITTTSPGLKTSTLADLSHRELPPKPASWFALSNLIETGDVVRGDTQIHSGGGDERATGPFALVKRSAK